MKNIGLIDISFIYSIFSLKYKNKRIATSKGVIFPQINNYF